MEQIWKWRIYGWIGEDDNLLTIVRRPESTSVLDVMLSSDKQQQHQLAIEIHEQSGRVDGDGERRARKEYWGESWNLEQCCGRRKWLEFAITMCWLLIVIITCGKVAQMCLHKHYLSYLLGNILIFTFLWNPVMYTGVLSTSVFVNINFAISFLYRWHYASF